MKLVCRFPVRAKFSKRNDVMHIKTRTPLISPAILTDVSIALSGGSRLLFQVLAIIGRNPAAPTRCSGSIIMKIVLNALYRTEDSISVFVRNVTDLLTLPANPLYRLLTQLWKCTPFCELPIASGNFVKPAIGKANK